MRGSIRGVLNGTQQELLLLNIIDDLRKRVGPNVILGPLPKTCRGYHILNPAPLYSRKHLVGWAGVQPRVGCLLVAIPDTLLVHASVSKMPGSWLVPKAVYGEGAARHWEICDDKYGAVYCGLIYALEEAYKTV